MWKIQQKKQNKKKKWFMCCLPHSTNLFTSNCQNGTFFFFFLTARHRIDVCGGAEWCSAAVVGQQLSIDGQPWNVTHKI